MLTHFFFCKTERIETVFSEWDLLEMNKESRQKLEKRFKFTTKYDHFLETNNLDGMELNYTIEYRICFEETSCRSLSKNCL